MLSGWAAVVCVCFFALLLLCCFRYDTIAMNTLIALHQGQGFAYSVHTKDLTNLNYAAEIIATLDELQWVLLISICHMTFLSWLLSMLLFQIQNIFQSRHRLDYGVFIFRHYYFGVLYGQYKYLLLDSFRKPWWFYFSVALCWLLPCYCQLREVGDYTVVDLNTYFTLCYGKCEQTQERMLRFTVLLQHHFRNRLSYSSLIFTHVVESLVFVPIMVSISLIEWRESTTSHYNFTTGWRSECSFFSLNSSMTSCLWDFLGTYMYRVVLSNE